MDMKMNMSILRGVVIAAVALISAVAPQQALARKKWKLVWEENFDGTTLDRSVWGDYGRCSAGPGRYYNNTPDVLQVRDGNLILKGIVNTGADAAKYPYKSASIQTKGKKKFDKGGKVEVRARFTCAQGAWPVIWMRPWRIVKGLIADGELDIMEHLNHDDFVYQTVHSPYTYAHKESKRYVTPKINLYDYNVYGVEIQENKIIYSVNGKNTFTYKRDKRLADQEQFPYWHDWYLILEMKLGGDWTGPIDSSQLPVQMEVDWVRYYEKK